MKPFLARVRMAWAVLCGRGVVECKHRPVLRGVQYEWRLSASGPTPVTMALLVCDDCGGLHVETLLGSWSQDQLTNRVPAMEVVERELKEVAT